MVTVPDSSVKKTDIEVESMNKMTSVRSEPREPDRKKAEGLHPIPSNPIQSLAPAAPSLGSD